MNTLKLSPDAAEGQPVIAPDTATTIGNDASAVLAAAAPFAPLAGPYGVAAVAIATGALAIYKAAIPMIQDLANKGLISADVQNSINAQFQDIAVTHATAFQGAEWKQD